MTFAFTDTHSGLLYLGDTSLKNKVNHLILLTETLEASDTWESILATEATNYTRPLLSFNDGVIEANTAVYSANPVEITADGSSIQFQSVGILQNAEEIPVKPVVSMTASNNQIVVNDHGLSVNDPIMFSGLGTIAEPLAIDIMYYVKTVVDTDTFTITDEPDGDAIVLTTDSSGLIDMRYGQGICIMFANMAEVISILDGQTYTFNVNNITFE